MTHHAITISVPPFSLGVSLGLRLIVDGRQGLVWIVPAIVPAPRWTTVIHVTHHAVLHHAMAHHAITISIPPLALGVSLGLRLIVDGRQGLVWVVPAIVPAPRWTTVIHVTHHAVLHHAMHAITISVPPLALGCRFVADGRQGLVWVVPTTIAPRRTSIVHVTHHALSLVSVTIRIHPFAIRFSFGSGLSGVFVVRFLANDHIGLIRIVPSIAP